MVVPLTSYGIAKSVIINVLTHGSVVAAWISNVYIFSKSLATLMRVWKVLLFPIVHASVSSVIKWCAVIFVYLNRVHVQIYLLRCYLLLTFKTPFMHLYTATPHIYVI